MFLTAGRQKLLNILLNDHIPQLTDLRDSVNESDLMLVIEYGSSQVFFIFFFLW